MNIITTILLWTAYLISLYITIFWLLVFLENRGNFKKEEEEERNLSRFPLVSIIIPAYNEESHVVFSIKSVLSLDYPKKKLQIVVVNDGSTDNTGKKVEGFIKKYNLENDRGKNTNKGKVEILLINKVNGGKASALNHGLKLVKGEFFACLDADSFVEKNTLKKMLYVYEKSSYEKNSDRNSDKLAIVTPAMKVKTPKKFLQKLQRIEYIVTLFVSRIMGQIDCLYVAPGPFSLYRADIIRRLGGFREENLTEDMEIAYRAQKHHYRIKHCYDAYVYTIAPKNSRELFRQRNRWFKGGLLNAFAYRKLLWNKDYGDFGFFQMSVNVINYFLTITGLSFFFYYVLYPIYKNIKNAWLVRFDIMPYLKDFFNFKFSYLDIDALNMFIFYILLFITITTFVLAHRNAKEKVRKANIFQLIYYFFLYYIMLSFITIVVIIEVLMGRKQKW